MKSFNLKKISLKNDENYEHLDELHYDALSVEETINEIDEILMESIESSEGDISVLYPEEINKIRDLCQKEFNQKSEEYMKSGPSSIFQIKERYGIDLIFLSEFKNKFESLLSSGESDPETGAVKLNKESLTNLAYSGLYKSDSSVDIKSAWIPQEHMEFFTEKIMSDPVMKNLIENFYKISSSREEKSAIRHIANIFGYGNMNPGTKEAQQLLNVVARKLYETSTKLGAQILNNQNNIKEPLDIQDFSEFVLTLRFLLDGVTPYGEKIGSPKDLKASFEGKLFTTVNSFEKSSQDIIENNESIDFMYIFNKIIVLLNKIESDLIQGETFVSTPLEDRVENSKKSPEEKIFFQKIANPLKDFYNYIDILSLGNSIFYDFYKPDSAEGQTWLSHKYFLDNDILTSDDPIISKKILDKLSKFINPLLSQEFKPEYIQALRTSKDPKLINDIIIKIKKHLIISEKVISEQEQKTMQNGEMSDRVKDLYIKSIQKLKKIMQPLFARGPLSNIRTPYGKMGIPSKMFSIKDPEDPNSSKSFVRIFQERIEESRNLYEEIGKLYAKIEIGRNVEENRKIENKIVSYINNFMNSVLKAIAPIRMYIESPADENTSEKSSIGDYVGDMSRNFPIVKEISYIVISLQNIRSKLSFHDSFYLGRKKVSHNKTKKFNLKSYKIKKFNKTAFRLKSRKLDRRN
jgi:hypothetical protein